LIEGTVSVVGDFNDWQPGVTTFGGRGSIYSATVEVERDRLYGFRYITEAGEWIDYEWGDGQTRDDQGVPIGVVDLTSTEAPLTMRSRGWVATLSTLDGATARTSLPISQGFPWSTMRGGWSPSRGRPATSPWETARMRSSIRRTARRRRH
jgi:hypothetical protein